MKKLFAIATVFFLVGICACQQKREKTKSNEVLAEVIAALKAADAKIPPPAPVVHEVKKLTRGHWQHFGVVGSFYRPEVKPGTVYGIEGGIMAFKTKAGAVWFSDFEPLENRNTLNERKVYLVHISGQLAAGCGYAMRDFRSTPKQCVGEEKILGWKEAKAFLKPKVNINEDDWAKIEKFYRQREWKTQ